MTQDYLDIYYTEEDFKSNVSGYKRLRNFSEFFNKEVTLPALFVWKNFETGDTPYRAKRARTSGGVPNR